MSQPIEVSTGIEVAVRVSGDVPDTQIDSQEVGDIGGCGFLPITGDKQVELAVDKAEVTLPSLALEKLPLAWATDERHPHPPVHCPDADLALRHVPGEDAAVVADSAVGLEGVLGVLVELIGVGYLGDKPHHNLRREGEAVSDFPVRELVKRELAKCPCLPRLVAGIVASGIDHLKSALERIRLLWCREQFHLGCELHAIHYIRRLNILKGGGGFLSPLKQGVSAARYL